MVRTDQDHCGRNWRKQAQWQEGLSTDSLIYFEKGIDIWSVLYFNKWYISVLFQILWAPPKGTEHLLGVFCSMFSVTLIPLDVFQLQSAL